MSAAPPPDDADLQALGEREARFRAIADSAPVLLWTAVSADQCNWVNRVWREFTGRTLEQECGAGWLDGIHPDDRRRCLDTYARGFERREPFTLEYRLRRHDGEYRWMLASGVPFTGTGGAFAGYVECNVDISDRKRAEETLRQSEERLQIALAASRQSVWEYDPGPDETILGPEWQRVTGYAPDTVRTLGAWLAVLHPDDREHCREAMQRCLSGEAERYESEYRVATPGGGWRWLRSRGRVERGPDGRTLRMLGTMMDVDEVHRLQEKLLASTRLASLGTLAAGVAHEVNNPLTWVLANLETVLERLDAPQLVAREELREPVVEAQEGARRIAGVIQAMRSLGRPERPADVEEVDVRGELLNAVQITTNQVLQRAGLELSIPDALPRVRAGVGELGRVFVNLLVNAAQAIPHGSSGSQRVSVKARVEGGGVLVEVADSGPGIAPATRDRIFEPFFTTKAVGEGTGLGLTLSRHIVEAAGGSIEVDSELGRGTTFRVRLPAAAGPHPIGPPTPAVPSGAEHRLRRRVLVIDDEPLVRRSLERILRRHHDVTTLESANEALRRIDAGETWDAILCDLMMADLDGIGFYDALAARHPLSLRRVAFISGGAFGERASAFVATRKPMIIAKPVQVGALLDAVEELAGAGSGPRSP